MHWHDFLFDLEKSNKDFSYTISPVKKNKCWKNFKIMRKSLFNYSLNSHPEIGNFRVWQLYPPIKGILSRDSRKVSKKQRLMWVFSKAYQLSSYRASLHKHTKHVLLFSIAHWTCIGVYRSDPTYNLSTLLSLWFLHSSLCSIIVLGRSTCASGFFLRGVT
jgi:hypothetical protein